MQEIAPNTFSMGIRYFTLCSHFELPSGKVAAQWVAAYNRNIIDKLKTGARWDSREVHAYADRLETLMAKFEIEKYTVIATTNLPPKPLLDV